MNAQVIASSCEVTNCPTIYLTPQGDVAVQGYTVAAPADVLPAGTVVPTSETVVTIPADVFEHLVQQYLSARVPA